MFAFIRARLMRESWVQSPDKDLRIFPKFTTFCIHRSTLASHEVINIVVCVKPRCDRPRAIRITGTDEGHSLTLLFTYRLRNPESEKKYHICCVSVTIPLSGNRTQLSHERTSQIYSDDRRAYWPIYQQRRWILACMATVEPGSGNAWWPYIGRVWCKTSRHKKDRFTMATTNLSALE